MSFIPSNQSFLQNWLRQQEKAKAEKEKAAHEAAQKAAAAYDAAAQAAHTIQNQLTQGGWMSVAQGMGGIGSLAQSTSGYPGQVSQIANTYSQVSANTYSTFGNTYVFRVQDSVPPSFDMQTLAALQASTPRRVDEPKSSMRVTDSLSCIVGWRAWRLWPDFEQIKSMEATRNVPLLLRAVAYHNTYPIMEKMTAVCLCSDKGPGPSLSNPMADVVCPPPHEAPGWECNCGIWAFKSLDRLVAVLGEHHYGKLPVLGTVNLWGKVIETENGFRAQYAYPKELWLVDPGQERLGALYKVPVRTADCVWPKETMELTYNTFI